jgi:N-acetylneuraminate synthase
MPMQPDRCYIVGEIGLNHNGFLDKAFKLIDMAVRTGCDAVKFQKRTLDVVYTPEYLATYKENPYGFKNLGEIKRHLEFSKQDYTDIDQYCREVGIDWYASPWDEASVDFLAQFDIPYMKLASGSITDRNLIIHAAEAGIPLLLSTGMTRLDQIKRSVELIQKNGGEIACIYHCKTIYPCPPEQCNLLAMDALKAEFPDIPIGYSAHQLSPTISIMAAALGAKSIEHHVTLSRAEWGSDHAASLEERGVELLVKGVRLFEKARGFPVVKVHKDEYPNITRLRRKDSV